MDLKGSGHADLSASREGESAAHPSSVVPVAVSRQKGEERQQVEDLLAAEEPLEIRLKQGESPTERFVVTMRSPGDDEDLAVGLLFAEGIIRSIGEVLTVDRLTDPRIDPELTKNVVIVSLSSEPGRKGRISKRNTVTGTACGVCGRQTIDEVIQLRERSCAARRPSPAAGKSLPLLSGGLLARLPGLLRPHQRGFLATGALHAAALFSADGILSMVREDVGRHNATDKVIGAALRGAFPMPPVLLVSGRIGFEIVQKAAIAGIELIAAVSAPTHLAVDLADEVGMTLVGFLRGESFNIYTHSGRIG
jgi:FdhD protein